MENGVWEYFISQNSYYKKPRQKQKAHNVKGKRKHFKLAYHFDKNVYNKNNKKAEEAL